MVIQLALQDGFDHDAVEIRVGGAEVFRDEQVTTRTQISHAADMQLDVPDGPFELKVELPLRGISETFSLDSHRHTNVALSLRDGQLVAAFPEQLGFA